MTALLVITISASSGAANGSSELTATAAPDYRSGAGPAAVAAPERCPSGRRGLAFYRSRYAEHRTKMGAGVGPRGPTSAAEKPSCPRIRFLAERWRTKAYTARTRAEVWIAEHVLSDFRVMAGARAWHLAVAEAQRPYPGTSAWLLSCSASEGGWGRWVPNSQGSGVGGWLQFHPSTFAGFSWRARVDAARRGYIVPGSASSWYSPLGQALAGAWGITHGMRRHWAGSGCW